jgi:N-methylhydantoinase B
MSATEFQSRSGTRGGLSGGPSSQFRMRPDGQLEPVPNCAEVLIRPDERMVSISCGGGGYGAPAERDPAHVAHDVREGWISRQRAERFIWLRSICRVTSTSTAPPP